LRPVLRSASWRVGGKGEGACGTASPQHRHCERSEAIQKPPQGGVSLRKKKGNHAKPRHLLKTRCHPATCLPTCPPKRLQARRRKLQRSEGRKRGPWAVRHTPRSPQNVMARFIRAIHFFLPARPWGGSKFAVRISGRGLDLSSYAAARLFRPAPHPTSSLPDLIRQSRSRAPRGVSLRKESFVWRRRSQPIRARINCVK